MILNDKMIREYVEKANMIENFNEDHLQAASYDVTISNKIFRFSDFRELVQLFDQETIGSLLTEVDISDGYNLLPNEYILVALNEKFNIPSSICAHMKTRTSLTRLGILTYSQFMNPTYSGTLNIGLHNISTLTYTIRPNISVAQFLFEQLTGEPTVEKLYENKVNAKYQGEGGETGSKIYSDEVLKKYAMLKAKYLSGEEVNE